MNFLFAALIITLLLLPGFIFRFSYLNVEHGSKTFKSTFTEELSFSLLPTVFLQLLWFVLSCYIWPLRIKEFYLLLINDKYAADLITRADVIHFIISLMILYILSYYLGYLLRYFAQIRNWEINYPLFRLYNDWYYTLRGFFIEKAGVKTFMRADEVWVDILVTLGNTSYIYRGMINDFVLSKDEGLDRIYISEVLRRTLADDKKEVADFTINLPENTDLTINYDEEESENAKRINDIIDQRYYKIPGLMLMIKYAEIKNINLSYVFYEEASSLSE